MPLNKLKEFLNRHCVKYICISHPQAFTAQEIAASAHVSGQELAKTVMVKLDGEMAMAVLPASSRLNLDLLKKATGAHYVEVATEWDFRDLFPECDIGAMPPFGNLWGMEVYVSERLADDREIAFNAGSHTELVRMSFDDYKWLVAPHMAKIAYADAALV